MRSNKTQSKFVTDCLQMNRIFLNDQFEVKDMIFPTDDVGIIYYNDSQEMHWGSNQTNVVLAAFVTCHARLKLYSELQKLQKRVLYFDTDSIIYKKLDGEYEPLLGDFLGQFTNEIEPEEGTKIVEFVCCGPKNYAYRLDSGITHCKVKGFSLNYSTSKIIDFQKLRRMITEDNDLTESVSQKIIVREKKKWSLKTKEQAKVYRMVYDKRIIRPDLSTIPYGFLI